MIFFHFFLFLSFPFLSFSFSFFSFSFFFLFLFFPFPFLFFSPFPLLLTEINALTLILNRTKPYLVRGDGANHGITDVSTLLTKMLPIFRHSSDSPTTTTSSSLKDAIGAYEDEMITRTAPAVLASRHACLDAHDYQKITDQSPLISRRAMVIDS